MDNFEKTAQLVEEGQSAHVPSFDLASSQTGQSTKSTGSQSGHEAGQQSSFWKRVVNVLRKTARTGHRSETLAATASQNENTQAAHNSKTRSREPIIRSLKQFPSGYPNLAAFADSDENFMLYRRFGYLQARVLLEKQDQLRRLKEQLDALDKSEMFDEPDNLFSRECQGEFRKGLLTSIEATFCEYGITNKEVTRLLDASANTHLARLLRAAQHLMTFNRPSTSEHRSVVNYLQKRRPVDKEEREYVYCQEDLVILRPGRENAWLDRSIEKLLRLLHCSTTEYIFSSKVSKMKASHKSQVYYSKDRVERCSVVIITIMILFLLIVPIYLLFHIVGHSRGLIGEHTNAVCIGILLVFTLIFSAVMSLFTSAKKHEILGAAAAYCAVLVVFFGNVGNVAPL